MENTNTTINVEDIQSADFFDNGMQAIAKVMDLVKGNSSMTSEQRAENDREACMIVIDAIFNTLQQLKLQQESIRDCHYEEYIENEENTEDSKYW